MRLRALVLLCAPLVFHSCADDGASSDDPRLTCETGRPAVTAAEVQAQIFTPTCRAGCHEPGGQKSSTDLSDETRTRGLIGAASGYGGSLKVFDPGSLTTSTA